ncbi:MAG: hypothetical protein IIY76_00200, partial [Erysipelotrichaceae bacterium]|nr:hypothetical protein [Erysipelotrichaceae bacterium]
MKLIFKYLKPYLFIVLTVVALTFVQVQTELTLPDYMSGIVTNGIQYGGVTEEMPHLITAKDMDDVLSFFAFCYAGAGCTVSAVCTDAAGKPAQRLSHCSRRHEPGRAVCRGSA